MRGEPRVRLRVLLSMVILALAAPARGQGLNSNFDYARRQLLANGFNPIPPPKQQPSQALDPRQAEVELDYFLWRMMQGAYDIQMQQAAHAGPPALSFGPTHQSVCLGPYEGAKLEIPFASFSGEQLVALDMNEQQRCQGTSCNVSVYGQHVKGMPTSMGWSYGPGAGLAKRFDVLGASVIIGNGGRPAVSCTAVVRYVYASTKMSLSFQPRGVEQSCEFSIQNTEDTTRCVTDAFSTGFTGAQCAVGPARLWSTDGQVALDFIDDPATAEDQDTAILRFPSGDVERMGRGGLGARMHRPAASTVWQSTPGSWDYLRGWNTQQRIDRNGNITELSYDSSQRAGRVTDPRGRVTTYRYDIDGHLTSVTAPGPLGADLTWTYTWSTLTWNPRALFPDLNCEATNDLGSPIVFPCLDSLSYTTLTGLKLPDGRTYTFSYAFPSSYKFGAVNSWGALTRVTTPDGAITEFTYGDDTTATTPYPPGFERHVCPNWVPVSPPGVREPMEVLFRRRLTAVTTRPMGASGPAHTMTIDHEPTQTVGSAILQWTRTTFPDGSYVREAVTRGGSFDGASGSIDGRTFAREVYSAGGALVEGTYFGNTGTLGVNTGVALGRFFVRAESASTLSGGQVLDARPTRVVHVRDGIWWQETFAYEAGGQSYFQIPTSTAGVYRIVGNPIEHQILAAGGATLLKTSTTYYHPAAYFNQGLRRLVATTTVQDGTGAKLARSDHLYDEEAPEAAPVDAARLDGSMGDVRGNPSGAIGYTQPAADGGPLRTWATYYTTGQAKVTRDPRFDPTTTYTHDFADCGPSHQTVTEKVTNALGQVTTVVSDCWTGLVLSEEEPSGARTCHQYDRWGRLVASAGPGDALPQETPQGGVSGSCPGRVGVPTLRMTYLPAEVNGQLPNGPTVAISSAKDGTTDGRITREFRDGLGRLVETCAEIVSPTETNPDRDAASVVERCVHTTYDGMGHAAEVSEPYTRTPSDAPSTGRPASAVFTRTLFDAIGRPSSMQTVNSGIQAITTTYGNEGGRFVTTTTVPSQTQDGTATAERVTKTYRNVLGHVDEVRTKWSGCTGDWCVTTVENDALGRTRKITDHVGNRTTFEYDGLGRRTSMTDPDLGTWTYAYDAAGNLVSQTDGRGLTVRMEYDSLSRTTRRDHPPVGPDEQDELFFYDGVEPTGCASCEDLCPTTDDACDTATMTCRHTPKPGAAACDAPATPPAATCGVLAPGRSLVPGQSVVSCDQRFRLSFQTDGNVVLSQGTTLLWETRSAGPNRQTLSMQGDGNLVLYAATGPVWASGTAGHPLAWLVVQNDGNAVLYEGPDRRPIWSTGTGGRHQPNPPPATSCGKLDVGQALGIDQNVRSCDGRFRLTLQSDGNAVLYQGNLALWASGTVGTPAVVMAMQDNGALVVYDGQGGARWSSGTAGHYGAWLAVQDDGNLVLYQGDRAIWSPDTRAVVCGDHTCNTQHEDCASCAADCACGAGEQCQNRRCAPVCGDGICHAGEDCGTCAADCACPSSRRCENHQCVLLPVCGDGMCNGIENCGTCPGDCRCGSSRTCNGDECCSPPFCL